MALPSEKTSELPAAAILAISAFALFFASVPATLFFTCEACIAKRRVLMLSLMESAACVTQAIRHVLLLPPRPSLRTSVKGEALYGMNVLDPGFLSIREITTRPKAVKDKLIDVASSNPCPH